MVTIPDRFWPEEGHCRVPFWVYSDPTVYAREQSLRGGSSGLCLTGVHLQYARPIVCGGSKPASFARTTLDQ